MTATRLVGMRCDQVPGVEVFVARHGLAKACASSGSKFLAWSTVLSRGRQF